MIRRLLFGLVLVLLALTPAVSRAATPQEVQETIDRAKAYLYAEQHENHTWEFDEEGHGVQRTGHTALAVYALLCAGESPQDPRLVPAIDFLRKTPTTGVYALGLRCQIWLMLPPTKQTQAVLTRDANLLVRSLKRVGDAKGFYDYNAGSSDGNYSHSRAQYGVLGVWAAAQAGVDIPKEYWKTVEDAWIAHQDPTGGWNYVYKHNRFPVTPGMTAVGVATLFITQDYVRAADGLACNGNITNPAIDRGMKWLSDNFDMVATDREYLRDLPYSTLYAIERVGVASGYKHFSGIDWYQKGADWLIRKQKSDGSWPQEFSGIPNYTTGLAILFLIRGSAPVLMNKLDYATATAGEASVEPGAPRAAPARAGDAPHWNQRPRDVANLARWVGRQVEREINWQIVNLDAPVEDFHDAPILYLSGNQALELAPEHQAKIKQFIEQGGLVVGNADCSSANFAKGFKALGGKLFPYEFAALPDNHVIYTNQQFPRAKWQRKPIVQSLGNGARELMILLGESDPARSWQQTQSPATTVPARDEHLQLGANIFLYAVDKKNLRRRGESYLVTPDEAAKPTRTIPLARITYSGNWDPEPGGWRRLAAVMRNQDAVTLNVRPVKLAPAALKDFQVAHLTGTLPFKLDAAQQAEIKAFVARGGTLIVDAAGGSSAFAVAAEAELAAIFPQAKGQLDEVLPAAHVIYNPAGKPIPVDYRTYARAKLGQLKGPRLRGVTVDHRLAVVYSREDLSVGLVGQSVDGVIGYDPATATTLMRRIIQHASEAKK